MLWVDRPLGFVRLPCVRRSRARRSVATPISVAAGLAKEIVLAYGLFSSAAQPGPQLLKGTAGNAARVPGPTEPVCRLGSHGVGCDERRRSDRGVAVGLRPDGA